MAEAYEGKVTFKAILFYLNNLKTLKERNSLAMAWKNKESINNTRCRNVISAINFITSNDIWVEREWFTTSERDPLFLLKRDDRVHVMYCCTFHEIWKYDGEKLVFEKNK